MDGVWTSPASVVASAVGRGDIDLPSVGDTINGERSPAARENFARLVADLGV